TYRTYDKQVELKASKGRMAARPGWSNHGYGLAIDIQLTPEQHTWMRENSIRFGWWHPLWARPDGTKPESWHWEYGSWLYDDRYKGKISDDQLTYNL
ncbi:MAG: M15 family metallopeptidase, partial [Kocuria sp.]|nr:M15 family metallopeptidase [Kocuria sp.]